MSEIQAGSRFIPKKGPSSRLNDLEKQDGLFIITTDNRKIYTDVTIDGVLTRIPLGGDINSIDVQWENILNKPFQQVSSDFNIVSETVNNETINKLFLADTLKITNKTVLDKFSEIDNELYYNNLPIGQKGTIVYKGQVNTYSDLLSIENPKLGWMYNVGTTEIEKYAYITNAQGTSGSWEPIYRFVDTASINNRITATQDSIASSFDANISYAVNSYVIYNNKLYICNTAHSGTWDASHFTETNIVSVINNIDSSGAVYTVSIPASGWSNSIPYTQTVTVNGISSNSNPCMDLIVSDTVATGILEIQNYNYITKATVTTNTLTLKCYETKPTVDLTVLLKT